MAPFYVITAAENPLAVNCVRVVSGIPALLPGEVITQAALDALAAVKESGGVISGCSDATLATMRVVADLVPSERR